MPRITVENVSKRFGRGNSAISDLSLEIASSEILAILGPSGSGKTTLLRLIAGLESPSSGRILIDGTDVTQRPARDRDVAMVFQNQAPYPHLNVQDNLAFSARARGVPALEINNRVRAVAAHLGIEEKLGRSPDSLSGGERQRVALGRAIVRRPSILLLDEPFSNLDTPLRRDLRALVIRFHRELGVTTVFVTHDQQEAVGVGDRVAVLHDGKLLQVGPSKTLFEDPANRFVAGFLGDPPMGLLSVKLEQVDGRRWLSFAGLPDQRLSVDGLNGLGDGDYVMGLRPEHITVSSGTSPGTITMAIRSIENNGLDRYARIGAREGLWAPVPRNTAFTHGDPLSVCLDLHAASWFDTVDGVRIR